MLLEKQRATKPLVHSSLSVPVESVGSSVLPVHLPHVVPSDDIDVDFNEDDTITAVDILPWELEHAEQELALLLRPAHARAEDADYVHSTPKKCSGKAKPVPADHNDTMLKLMIKLGGKHNYDVQAMFEEYDFIYRTEAVCDRSTDLRYTTKPLVRQWVNAFSKRTEQSAAFDRHNPAADLLLQNAQPSILVPPLLAETAPPIVTPPMQLPPTTSHPTTATESILEKSPNIWWLNAMKGDDLLQAGDSKNICTECKKHYLKSTTHPTRAFPGTASKYRYCPLTYPDFDDWMARVLPQKHADRSALKKRPPDFCTSCNGSKHDGKHIPAAEGSKYFFCPQNKQNLAFEDWQQTWGTRFTKMEESNRKIAQGKHPA